jgi:hypothetical protein
MRKINLTGLLGSGVEAGMRIQVSSWRVLGSFIRVDSDLERSLLFLKDFS